MMGLFLGLIFAIVGTVYLVIGRRDHDPFYYAVGAALLIFPYFVSNVILAALMGTAIALIPLARAREWF